MKSQNQSDAAHAVSYITSFTERYMRRQGWKNDLEARISVCSLLILSFFLRKPNFMSCLNQGFSTSVAGNPTRRAICSWSHVSLLKINIAAVERHLQGGRRTASAGVEVKDMAVVSLEGGGGGLGLENHLS